MMVAIDKEIEIILNQIAEANEQIEAAQAILDTEATRGNYKGMWAETNYRRQRGRVAAASHRIADNKALIEYLQHRLEFIVDNQSTNVVNNEPKDPAAVDAALKDDPELLAFLLAPAS